MNKQLATAIALMSCGPFVAAGQAAAQDNIASNPSRNAYYGDLHLHTSYSFDAYIFMGARTGPDEAYRFARGESIPYLGHTVQRRWPLDFLAVTDHSENIGVFNSLDEPSSDFSRSDFGKRIKAAMASGDKTFFWQVIYHFVSGTPIPGVDEKTLAEVDTKALAHSAWQRIIDTANKNYRPGKFTTFIGYEWTSMPDSKYNLHRNVIFSGATAPDPFTSVDSLRPEDLWSYLEKNRAQGVEALAIPHNADGSNGLMYDWNNSDGRPIDQAYAQRRATNEPLTEISQTKGQSETVPELSSGDEFANFEVFEHLLISKEPGKLHGSYVREALGRGLVIDSKTGANPYRYGFVGGTDSHNGLTTGDEDAYNGSLCIDPNKDLPSQQEARTILTRSHTKDGYYDTLDNGSGNLTGVWAESNTRESIYSALRRKETFATSGTRLKFRFFGGWDYPTGLLKSADWIKAAYASGVPMGGDLPATPGATHAPRAPKFVVWATKAPDGANLDRLQVVKVWLKDGESHEQVFDVALSNGRKVDPTTGKAPAVGTTVDLKTATYTNTIGATELKAIWEDPAFDHKAAAVYYLRVLEIPTPRWSTLLAVKRGLPLPEATPATLQERGWSSPIWYNPSKQPASGSRS